MRTQILPFAAFALLRLVAAQPHRHVHKHRDVAVVVTTVVVDVIATSTSDKVVYVDEQGKVLSTAFMTPQVSSPSAQPTENADSSTTSDLLTGSKVLGQQSINAAAVAPAQPDPTEPSASNPPATDAVLVEKPTRYSGNNFAEPSSSSRGLGITYSPYNNDGTCKTQDQVNADFVKIQGYALVRIYGTDCNQVTTVGKVAKAKGMKLFAGVFDVSLVNREIAQIITAVNGEWSHISTISIGNEVVNTQGSSMVGPVVNAIGSARTQLKAAGYTGPVVTVDTFNAIMAHPELCHASDFAATNAHAFFDPDVEASGAGEWAIHTAQGVSSACGGKRTVITESGWPSQGSANGQAVPSLANQVAAISSLKGKFTSDMILFSAFNDLWKQDSAGTFGTEHFWGILGNAPE